MAVDEVKLPALFTPSRLVATSTSRNYNTYKQLHSLAACTICQGIVMYDVRAIGNWFLDRAAQDGQCLTAMKLQKLAYVAHGWYLAFENKPLVHDAVEAWRWGPVFRSLYREFREFGSHPIEKRATAFDGATLADRTISIFDYDDSDAMSRFLESVWEAYGKYSAADLSNITNQPGTPWHDIYEKMGNSLRPYTIIPNEQIREHYEKLLNERASSAG